MIGAATMKQKGPLAASLGRGRRPLVGYVSNRNTIEVRRKQDRLIVQLSRGTYLFVIFAAALFGPMLSFFVLARPEMLNPNLPAFAKFLLLLLNLGAWLWFFHSLVTRPRIEIPRESGDLLFFVRGSKPSLVIPRQQIAALVIEDDAYGTAHRSIPNAVAAARLTDGDTVRLFASPDSNFLASLIAELATLTRTTLIDKSSAGR
jgi:hypothetical protein